MKKFIYASSSLKGKRNKNAFSIKHRVDNPVSLYAMKKSTELLAECYSHLFKINCIGLYFTVYGPLGRPDIWQPLFLQKNIGKKKNKYF